MRFQIRTFLPFGKVGGIDKVDVGYLLATLDIVKDNHSVIVKVYGIDKNVDDAPAVFLVHGIAGAYLFQHCPHFGFR